MLADLDTRFPYLSEWMAGARPGQLWNYDVRVEPPDTIDAAFASYAPLEAVLRDLHRANPARLDGKRREFRSVMKASEMRGLQVELAFGAKLARCGVPFDFGAPGTPQPDIVLRDRNLGVELTAKKADALWDLKWHLMRAFKDSRPRVMLNLTFSAVPFAIRTRVRDELVEEIRRAVDEGEREVYAVVRPSKPGEHAITVRVKIGWESWYSWPHMYVEESGRRHELAIVDAERAVLAAMGDKRKKRQGESMPTLLLVDIADVRHVRQRSNATWLKEIGKSLNKEHAFVGLGVLHTTLWRNDTTVAIAENPYADPLARSDLRALGQALSLRVIGDDEPSYVRAPLRYELF